MKQFVAMYSLAGLLTVRSRFIDRANAIQSSVPLRVWSMWAIAAVKKNTWVSMNATRRSGNRSNTPPAISCHSDRDEKNAFSTEIVMIDANPGGL